MRDKEYTNEEIEELDGYLINRWNYDIYEQLCGVNNDVNKDLFEPLEFFRLLYIQLDFVKANKAKPLFVSRNLKKLPLTNKQLDFICLKILSYFSLDEDFEQLNIFFRELLNLRNSLGCEEEAEFKILTLAPFNFDTVLTHLETLNDYSDKIAYLIEVKTIYQQNPPLGVGYEYPNFIEKCNLEIEKLEKLLQLKSIPVQTEQNVVEVKKNRDLTVDRSIFLLNYLIPSFTNLEATKKAKFINFLTGFDYETIRQRFSSIPRKEADQLQSFKKDMDIIIRYLDDLGLRDLTMKIKKDLDFK